MKRPLTPQEKKKNSLEKDHPIQAKYPKAFRKKWPKNKRIAEKRLRSQIRDELHLLQGGIDPDAIDQGDTTKFRREKVRKWGSAPLGEVIEQKKERRVRSHGRKKRSQFQRLIEQAIRRSNPDISFCTVYSPQPKLERFYAFIHFNLVSDSALRWNRLEIVKRDGGYFIEQAQPHDGMR